MNKTKPMARKDSDKDRNIRNALQLTHRDALFFDLDGTLLEIAASPDMVHIPAGLATLFDRLSTALDGAVAIITGRDMAFVEQVFGGAHIAASASHGATLRRKPGAPVENLATPPDFALLERISRHNTPTQMPKGIWIEKKDFACAFHFRKAVRGAPQQKAQHIEQLVKAWAQATCDSYNGNFSSSERLSLTEGDMVVELGPQAVTKGTALEIFMNEAAFKGRRPVFFGDAKADRPGMEAAQRPRNGITGKAVAVGPHAAPFADFMLPTPRALRSLLQRQLYNGPKPEMN